MKAFRYISLLKETGQNKGFTLVELMVVAAILGILVSIAVPIYVSSTEASERAVVEANLRILDSSIMIYVTSEGVYPVNNYDPGAIEWIIQNPSWNDGNALEPYVSRFSSIKGERYAIYGAASAPGGVTIGSNRAFIVLSAGDAIGGHTATGDEYYHLQNLPWKQNKPSILSHILQWSDGSFTLNSAGHAGSTPSSAQTLGGTYEGTEKSIIIPKTINGTIIKQLNQELFRNKGLESVAFAVDTEINRIHGSAFRDNYLTEISFPDTLVQIDGNAFNNNLLQGVLLPDSIKTVQWDAFRNNKIEKIKVGSNVSIGNNAFIGNPLVEIEIGNNVQFGTNVFPEHNKFIAVYEQGGAGVYKLIDGQWVKQ
ncbi:MAG: hypothetical protein AVO34_10540 [Firmicutes bacterium ML8_F2]|jgi:prepilin-type N-terminal cleavage/methylation domain-containing protein|nr:MAG: hypothetical protein AVO34_10540 [Firmicutes bacterium ML8_F2]